MPTSAVIMLAPNGAKLSKEDHPALPLSISETVEAAVDGQSSGAMALHAHVRDTQGQHVLDESLYRILLEQSAAKLGDDFPVQITTEAVGRYTPCEQIKLIRSLQPRFCSIGLRELLPTVADTKSITASEKKQIDQSQDFYHWAYNQGIGIQHILYGLDDVHYFLQQRKAGHLHPKHNAVLIVLGRYGAEQLANVSDVTPVAALASENKLDWMLCAFGRTETDSLVNALSLGGHVRIGFENNRENRDGSIAADNSERIRELKKYANTMCTNPATNELMRVLGQPD